VIKQIIVDKINIRAVILVEEKLRQEGWTLEKTTTKKKQTKTIKFYS